MEDLRNVKFTSSEQFLIGERVKIISYTPTVYSTGYSSLVGQTGVISYNFNFNLQNGYYDKVQDVYVTMGGGTAYNVNVADLDLAIEDETIYNEIKSERFRIYNIYQEYRKIEVELLKKKLYEDSKDILAIFEEVYPNQFDYSFSANNILDCIIHFPEINIKNSRNSTHKIVDLYIKMSFRANKTIASFNGCRSVVTLAERMSRYAHSHMSSNDRSYQWLSCCLGESEFAQTYSLLCNRFNADNLTRFLYQLPEYLSWESLEGGPYVKMENITNSSNSSSSMNVNSTDVERSYKKLLETINVVPVKINKELVDIFRIEGDATLEELILPVAGNYICNKINNQYLLTSNSASMKSQLDRENNAIKDVVMFTFKGQPIKPKVVACIGESSNDEIKAPYPMLTTGISNELTKRFNEYVTSESNK